MPRKGNNTYRDGAVHVCDQMCTTCIFRPGNLMQLRGGRVRDMVDDCREHESAIVCHNMYDGDHAICRGGIASATTSSP